jgi:hypothetical protein
MAWNTDHLRFSDCLMGDLYQRIETYSLASSFSIFRTLHLSSVFADWRAYLRFDVLAFMNPITTPFKFVFPPNIHKSTSTSLPTYFLLRPVFTTSPSCFPRPDLSSPDPFTLIDTALPVSLICRIEEVREWLSGCGWKLGRRPGQRVGE